MHNNSKKPHITISPIHNRPGQYIAAFSSRVLDATFSVMFQETITGAVALHTFAEMIRNQYGHAVEISLPDSYEFSLSKPVQDLVTALKQMNSIQIKS